jgi:hypothetical protein
MKILTVATHEEGYYNVLKQTAKEKGFDLKTLGWNMPWKGLAWKIDLYLDELKKCSKDEPVICVDGYDVVVIGEPEEVYSKFKQIGQPILFSGQRYFPNQRWIQRISDQLMSNSKSNSISKVSDPLDYSRPCMGLLIAYAGALIDLFERLQAIEKQENIGNDQILLNVFYLNNPDKIYLDRECQIFQNLWRTRNGIYGSVSSKDKTCEVEIVAPMDASSKRVRNKRYKSLPCFLHGPLNLDMSLLLGEIDISVPKMSFKKGLHYWNYSIMYYVKRAITFFLR